MNLRTGIIGLGDFWEARHAPALRSLSDRFQVVAIYDPIAKRADRVAKEWNARPVYGFNTLTSLQDVDAVLVLSAKWIEELPLLAACQSGKAVYCAAPLELDNIRAESLREVVDKAGVAFVAELPYRHAPATLRLKELIATRLGDPKHMVCNVRRSSSSKGNHTQHFYMNQLIHQVDWCRYIADCDPTSVTGFVHQTNANIEKAASQSFSSVNIGLDFSKTGKEKQGPFAEIQWQGLFNRKWEGARAFQPSADMQVVCERGMAFVDFPDKLTWFDDAGQHSESLEMDRTVGEQLFLHFYRAVTSLLRNTSSLDNAYQAVKILSLCNQSIAEQRSIPIQ